MTARIASRQEASVCSVGAATTISIDYDRFPLEVGAFALTTVPNGAGSGTLNVEYSLAAAPTVFVQALLADGSNCTLDLSKVDCVTFGGIDVHSVKLTPSGVSGVTDYAYSLAAFEEV
jgi:hypothetical protein